MTAAEHAPGKDGDGAGREPHEAEHEHGKAVHEPHEGHDRGEAGHEHGEAHDGGPDHDHEQGSAHDHGQASAHDHGSAHDHDHDHGGGPLGVLRSIFRPHSHDAGASVDSALETSREGMRALVISLVGLAVTAVFQVVIVAISGSVALLADTIHNFSDALTAIPLGFAFLLGRRLPTRRYTYGYGRAEDLAGIFIVAMIALSAVVAGYESARRLVDPQEVSNIGWVVAAGVVGFVGNEAVALYRMRVGRKIGSAALVADGLHARTDGFTSLAVVGGALGTATGFELADPIVGLLITVAILVVLKGAATDIYRRLMDSVDPELVDQIEDVLSRAPGVQGVDAVRVRWVGHELVAEADIVADRDLSLDAAHDIAEEARHGLLHGVRRLTQATIHVSPCGHDGRDPHASTSHHFADGPTPARRGRPDPGPSPRAPATGITAARSDAPPRPTS